LKFIWLFLNIVFLSAFTVSTAVASSDNKSSVDFQAMQPSVVLIAQASATDAKKPAADSSSDIAKKLPAIVPEASKQSTSYHRRSNSYATNPDSDPPRYVRQLSDIGVEAFKDITWAGYGLEHRTRYEWRNNDIRRIEGGEDNPFFLRNRAWIGIKDILDPFRFAVEFQDSRIYNNKHAVTGSGKEMSTICSMPTASYISKKDSGSMIEIRIVPIRLRVGRMAYENNGPALYRT